MRALPRSVMLKAKAGRIVARAAIGADLEAGALRRTGVAFAARPDREVVRMHLEAGPRVAVVLDLGVTTARMVVARAVMTAVIVAHGVTVRGIGAPCRFGPRLRWYSIPRMKSSRS